VHPDAHNTVLEGYAARLAAAPDDIPALTGASFARWVYFDYGQAIHLLNHQLAVQPNSPYANLFRGSSRVLRGATPALGKADLEEGIALDPENAHVRFIVADAYTYGLPDAQRAFAEASLAMEWGVPTPRIHAILATSQFAFGDAPAAAAHLKTHIDLVTTQLLTSPVLAAGTSRSLALVPGRTYEVPVPATAGETLSITTSSPAGGIWDSIIVLLDPHGSPVTGSDDARQYFAGFDWTPGETGTYRLQVTSFESVNTGTLLLTRR